MGAACGVREEEANQASGQQPDAGLMDLSLRPERKDETEVRGVGENASENCISPAGSWLNFFDYLLIEKLL